MGNVCHPHIAWLYCRDWFGVVANKPGITQTKEGEQEMNRNTFRDWRKYAEVAIAMGMIAGASFIGAGAAHWVFGP